ncbi:MAG: sigma-70 family RNA polymerase sigma factor [Planctomycetota bacterium]|nr:MAG: sigma-70 family RNA polymerase sigma factor [Planctomycetota bacterium]
MANEERSSADADASERMYAEFVALLARHEPALRRFIRSLMPSDNGVDDVVQETALECWRKFAGFQVPQGEEPDAAFMRWASVIARFKAMSWQRDQARDRLVFRAEVIEKLAEEALESSGQWQQHLQAVQECLSNLTADQRRLVLAVHTPQESVARIAAEAGIAPRRLYSRVGALRRKLRVCVESRVLGGAGYE